MNALKDKKFYIETYLEGKRNISVQSNDPRDFPKGNLFERMKLSTELKSVEDIDNLMTLLRNVRTSMEDTSRRLPSAQLPLFPDEVIRV